MSSLPALDVHSVTYQDSVRAFLKVLAAEESFNLPEDQLAFSTLDGLTEVLEWNNEGQAADEIACIWLASLRWYTRTGNLLSASAPYSLPRMLSTAMPEHAGSAADPATISGLALPEMQLLDRNLQKEANGPGSLLRSLPVALLPVDQDQTVAVIAAKVAALTHGSELAISATAALAILARACLAFRGQSATPLAEALTYASIWAEGLATNLSIPGEGQQVSQIFAQALEAETELEKPADSESPAQLESTAEQNQDALAVLQDLVAELKAYEEQKVLPVCPADSSKVQLLTWTISSALIALAHGSQALEIKTDSPAQEALALVQRQWFKELGISKC